jgi:hypothetical protein
LVLGINGESSTIMKDSPSSKARPAARREPARTIERPLRVRFYCSMKPQRIYPLVVESPPLRRGETPLPSLPVTIRPIIAGALVTPPEQKLDVSAPGSQATFHVTPLASGRVPNARVEVHNQGRLADQVRLRMKARSQRRTWILLALTFLLPWLLLAVTHERYPYRAEGKVPGRPPDLRAEPGEVLEYRITSWIDTYTPSLPYVKEHVTTPAAHGLGVAYTWACHLTTEHLYFWLGVVLFCLTLLSWVSRRTQRSTRWKTLVLAAPVAAAEAGETLPLSPRDELPIPVQPAQ